MNHKTGAMHRMAAGGSHDPWYRMVQSMRGGGGSMQEVPSPYKRPRTQSPGSSGSPAAAAAARPGPYAQYPPQDGRTTYGMHVPAPYPGIYSRDPPHFQREQQQHPQVSSADYRDARYHEIPRRRPSMLGGDYHLPSSIDRDRAADPYRQQYQYERQDYLSVQRPQVPQHHPADINPSYKRPRLAMEPRQDLMIPLKIDTSTTVEVKKEPAYNPKVEAISPTLPSEELSSVKSTKDEVLQQINKADREISIAEQQLGKLQKKLHNLEEQAKKPPEEKLESAEPERESKHQSIAQIIYAANRKKAASAHDLLNNLGPKIELPLYNQPSDTAVYHENKRKYMIFKSRLILHFKKRHQQKRIRERYLTERYDQLMQTWLKRVERLENSTKRRAKDTKTREFFEKVFPEIKKQREEKERFQRVSGSRAVGGAYARSEADLEQIMDGLHEQEEEDRKMRNYAVIPPMMLDSFERRHYFNNNNGLIEDPMAEYKERSSIFNIWTDAEKEIFREKYLQHPKNFGWIASFLDRKQVQDCVQYYYLSKKSENYKHLLRKQSAKSRNVRKKIAASRYAAEEKEGKEQEDQAVPIITPHDKIKMEEEGDKQSSCPSATATPSAGVTSTAATAETSAEPAAQASADSSHQEKKIEETPVQRCAVCKNDLESGSSGSNSRPLTKVNCELYGIPEADVTPDMRVCSSCRCRCPVPTCRTPKRKVKRLRPLPSKWLELPPETKEPIMKELQLTEEITKCCSVCFNRIARKLGTNPSTNEPLIPLVPEGSEDSPDAPHWNEEEIESAKQGLREHGRNWTAVAQVIGTKTDVQCKNFYFNNKRKLALEGLVDEYRRKKVGHSGGPADCDTSSPCPLPAELQRVKRESNRTTSTSESVASTMTAPSEEELSSSDDDNGEDNGETSDTASAPSPAPRISECDGKDVPMEVDVRGEKTDAKDATVLTTENPNLTASQSSLRSQTDYDSSATLSADEGPGGLKSHDDTLPHRDGEGGGEGRQPHVLSAASQQGSGNKSSVPGSGNGDKGGGDPSSPACVRDIIDSAIERHLGQDLTVKAPSQGGREAADIRQLHRDTHEHLRRGPIELHSRSPQANYYSDPKDFDPHDPRAREMLARQAGAAEDVHCREAPPPAHSHHAGRPPTDALHQLATAATEQRDQQLHRPPSEPRDKSPMYHLGDRTQMTPPTSRLPPSPYQQVVSLANQRAPPVPNQRQPIGQPPPLINIKSPKLPMKPEKMSPAGGSITAGTPVQQPPGVRYEAGSISSGTPRYEPHIRHAQHPSDSARAAQQPPGGSITRGTPITYEQQPAPSERRTPVSTHDSAPPKLSQSQAAMLESRELQERAAMMYGPMYQMGQRRLSPTGSAGIAGFYAAAQAFSQYAAASGTAEQAHSSSRATLMDDFRTARQMQHAEQERRAAQEKERQLSPRSREVLAREGKYMESLPPHLLSQFGPVMSTHQGMLYAAPPGQVPTSSSSERAGARTTSPMPPRDATPPRAAEERAASVGSTWPPQHHLQQPRGGHPQHSPGGPPSRPGEHPRHPTPPPRAGVIHRNIMPGTVIIEPRTSEAAHLSSSRFATLVDVAANQQHMSVPGKDRHPQLSPAARGDMSKDGRSDQMSKEEREQQLRRSEAEQRRRFEMDRRTMQQHYAMDAREKEAKRAAEEERYRQERRAHEAQRAAVRPDARQGNYPGAGLSMYPQRPYMGHGSRGQDSREQRDIRNPHDLRHLPPQQQQQHDPHGAQQQMHQRPPDPKTGERGASNTNPYSHFEKGGGVGPRNKTNQSPIAVSAQDEAAKPGNAITAASLIDAIIHNTINKNPSETDSRNESLGLITRLKSSESPRSQAVPAASQVPQSRSYSDQGRSAHGQRSPGPYKPHKAMGRYEGDSQPQGRPAISGGSITAGIPVAHHQQPPLPHHPPPSSSGGDAPRPSIVSPNAAAGLSSEALRSITLGEHIDYIILQDYNGKNPPPGAMAHTQKDDAAGMSSQEQLTRTPRNAIKSFLANSSSSGSMSDGSSESPMPQHVSASPHARALVPGEARHPGPPPPPQGEPADNRPRSVSIPNHHKALGPYRMGDHPSECRPGDTRPPVSPLGHQANGPASGVPPRISQVDSDARPRAYSTPGQAAPMMHNWKLKRALDRSREETAQSPQVLAPDERQIVKIARLDQNARPGEASAAAQSDARPGYSHERQPYVSQSEGSPRSPRHTGQPGVSPQAQQQKGMPQSTLAASHQAITSLLSSRPSFKPDSTSALRADSSSASQYADHVKAKIHEVIATSGVAPGDEAGISSSRAGVDVVTSSRPSADSPWQRSHLHPMDAASHNRGVPIIPGIPDSTGGNKGNVPDSSGSSRGSQDARSHAMAGHLHQFSAHSPSAVRDESGRQRSPRSSINVDEGSNHGSTVSSAGDEATSASSSSQQVQRMPGGGRGSPALLTAEAYGRTRSPRPSYPLIIAESSSSVPGQPAARRSPKTSTGSGEMIVSGGPGDNDPRPSSREAGFHTHPLPSPHARPHSHSPRASIEGSPSVSSQAHERVDADENSADSATSRRTGSDGSRPGSRQGGPGYATSSHDAVSSMNAQEVDSRSLHGRSPQPGRSPHHLGPDSGTNSDASRGYVGAAHYSHARPDVSTSRGETAASTPSSSSGTGLAYSQSYMYASGSSQRHSSANSPKASSPLLNPQYETLSDDES